MHRGYWVMADVLHNLFSRNPNPTAIPRTGNIASTINTFWYASRVDKFASKKNCNTTPISAVLIAIPINRSIL